MSLLCRADSPELWAVARRLVEEYAASLNVDLSYQDFQHELDSLSEMYGPPGGCYLMARQGDVFLGGVGLRRLTPTDCEMKRLYVTPSGRGTGVGRTLAQGVVWEARRLGYERMLLDTLPTMTYAQALYRSMGFQPIDPYRFSPVPGTTFLGLDLRTALMEP
jgi:GNAT superfamily N-acetyltransferase